MRKGIMIIYIIQNRGFFLLLFIHDLFDPRVASAPFVLKIYKLLKLIVRSRVCQRQMKLIVSCLLWLLEQPRRLFNTTK